MRRRDWRVGVPLLLILTFTLWVNVRATKGDFGGTVERSVSAFWKLR